jgi:hypothetical protein
LLNLFKTVHVFGEASVHAHYFLVDKCNQGHVVKAVVEGLPQTDFVSALNFVEEAVDAGDGLALVVAS